MRLLQFSNNLLLSLLLLLIACEQRPCISPSGAFDKNLAELSQPYALVMGIAQDAGYPQVGCPKDCCARVLQNTALPERVTCLAVVDPVSRQSWLLDATPDLSSQWDDLVKATATNIAGIFPTHAHIGHYTGLIYLGREAMGADKMPVYAMPRLDTFLRTNGPWSQLVTLENIDIRPLQAGVKVILNERIAITPIAVPHRDEFSETVALLVEGPEKKLLYLPDINKWEVWERSINELVREVDYAFLDGTFYDGNELPNRDMAEIPHPFIVESLAEFEELSREEKGKIYFTHFNHTNPLLQVDSKASAEVLEAGYQIAREGMVLEL